MTRTVVYSLAAVVVLGAMIGVSHHRGLAKGNAVAGDCAELQHKTMTALERCRDDLDWCVNQASPDRDPR